MMMSSTLPIMGEITLKASALLLLCAAAAAILRRSSAAMQHALWTAALAASVLVVPLAILGPSWEVVPAPPALQPTTRVEIAAPPSIAPAVRTATSAQQPSATASTFEPARIQTPPAPELKPIRTQQFSWREFVFPIWVIGCMLVLAHFAIGSLRVASLIRKSAEVEDAAWLAALRLARQRLGVRAGILLLQSDDLDVPIVFGTLRPRVVIPSSALPWTAERRLAVLLHELAHVKRFDVWTQLVAQAAVAIHWFNPLFWIARAKTQNLRERACDDHVLQHGALASVYAQELLAIVSQLRPRESYTAALAMARRSQFEGRLLAILDPQVHRRNLSRLALTTILLLSAVIVLPGASLKWKNAEIVHAATPQAAAQVAQVHEHSSTTVATPARATNAAPATTIAQSAPSAPTQSSTSATDSPVMQQLAACSAQGHGDSTSSNIYEDNGSGRHSWIVKWSRGNCSINLQSEGEVKFNERFDEVTNISNGGWVDMTMRIGDETRRARYEPSDNGVRVQYWLNGNEMPMDASAKAWVRDFFIMLDRQSAFAIDYRFPQLMKEGGPNRVLDEVNAMYSDYAKAQYLLRLVQQSPLKTAELDRTIDTTLHVSSDYETARVLMAIASKYDLEAASTRASYLRALDKLKSDYEHARVLLTFFGKTQVPPELAKTVLESAAKLKSDYELARVLIEMSAKKMVTGDTEAAYVATIGHLNSDYEHARTLIAYLGNYGSDQQRLGPVIQQVSQIKSDYEASRVLQTIAQFRPQGELRDAYIRAANNISSDYERKRALSALGYKPATY